MTKSDDKPISLSGHLKKALFQKKDSSDEK